MAYDPTNWSAGKSITADLMNKIEQGIKKAASDSSDALSAAQSATSTVGGFQATLNDHDSRLDSLEGAETTNESRIQQGVDAWTQVRPTLTYNGNNITKTLKKRLEDNEDIVDKIRVNVEGAKRTTQDSLSKRFNDLDDSIDLINGDISTINETFRSAAGSSYNDIQSRFNADEDAIDELDERLDPIEAQMKKALADRNYTGAAALDNRFKATEDKLTAAKTSDYFPGQEFTLDGRFENIEKEIVTARTSNAYGSTSNNPVVYTHLDDRFEEIEKEIKAGRGGNNNLITHFNDLDDAKVNYTDIVNGLNYAGDAQKKALDAKQGKALNERINSVINAYESADTGLSSRITTLETNVNGAKITNGAQTLDARFDSIDGGSAPSRNLPNIISEIEGAHTSGVILTNEQNTPYTDLDDRFSAIERYAVWTRGKVTEAFSSHANATTEGDASYTSLDQRFETDEEKINTINSTLGTGFDTNDNTVAKKIAATESAVTTYVDNRLGNGVNPGTNTTNGTVTAQMTSVRSRIGAIENELSEAHVTGADSLDARFEAIDGGSKAGRTLPDLVSEVETARGNGNTSLNQRLNGIDTAITTLNGNAQTSGSVLNTVNSRIAEVVNGADEAFDTLKEIADWIGTHSSDALTMQQNIGNNTSAISGLDTRLTAIDNDTDGRMKVAEDNIDAIEGKLGSGFNSTTGNTVAEKIAAVQSAAAADATTKAATAEQNAKAYADTKASTAEQNSKDYTDSGLAGKASVQSVNDLDERLDSIDGGSTLSIANGTLGARVTALEGKDTIVVNYDGIHSNYTEINGIKVPNYDSPTINADYLIEDTDEKYYYWRFINNEWKLISGAGSGAGNSNAEDYATIAAFEQAEKELNKDYYVLDNNGFRHHYRYLSTATTAQPIEIGISPSLVKSYQIDTSEGVNNQQEQTQYLDLYGFDLGQVPTTINPEDHLSYRLAHIPLPKGGGESSGAYRIYAKVKDGQTRRVSYSDIQTNGLALEYSYTCCSLVDGEYAYKAASWTLSTGGEIIESSNGVVDPLDKTVAAAGQSSYDAGAINIITSNLFKYCQKNQTTTFNLTLHVETGENEDAIADRTISVYVTAVELSLASTFSDQRTYNNGNNLQIPYTFTGMSGQEPIFEVLLDNTSIAPSITSTDINIRSTTLANLTGVHNLSIRASQQVSGATLYSNTLNYQLGLIDSQSNDILIFSGASLENQLVEQYHVLKLPYYLYVPNNEEIEVTFTVEQVVGNVRERVASLSRPNEMLTTGAYEYTFRIYEMIANEENYILTINADNASLVFNITASRAAEEINIKKENLVFDFKPDQFNNNTPNEEDRLWQYKNGSTTYKMRIPEGSHFDWRTGGWITVTEGNKTDIPCFCVKAGSRVEFVKEENGVTTPLTLFWPNMESQGGSNFKCTFKIDNVKTPDAPFLTSLDNTVNTVINYGPLILSEKQDIEDDDTLLYNYLGVKYIYTETINNKNKVVKEAIGTTVLNSNPFSAQLTEALRSASEVSARSKNGKKIKNYISNIYDIANQASVPAHREYLLKILSGKDPDNSTIDASTIKSEITSYLFDENAYNANDGSITNTVAQQVYNTLVSAGEDPNSIIYAYRHLEPVNFDALLNGFIVEGKDGKDGIIAMMLFTFASSIQAPSNFTQTVSENPISTNSFAKTGTFEVTVTDTRTDITKKYEVEMVDKSGTGVYTEIKSIHDASNTENKAYGLELNALGSNIYLPSGVVNYPYSEGDIIEFEYNVNAPIRERINSSVIIYEDGVPSAAKLYTVGNNTFEQNNPGYLTIGSDDCDVYIYKMRLYDKALENSEILKNFYADGLTVDDMSARYSRNKNLVNAVKNNTITPQLVAEECPDLRVIMIEAPTLTGGKTSFIKNTKIRCIYKNGRPEDNWVALNAYHAGQGTSSDNYGAAGRNLDIIFGFDGEDTVIIPKPQKNNYTFDPTYRSIVITGLDDDNSNDIRTAAEYEADGYNVVYNEPGQPTGKVSLTSTSVPNNWFNIKVNIASSENVNNAYLQKRFDRYLPYKDIVPARVRGREEDIDIKNDMEFFNCVIFIKETGTASEFVDDNEIDPSERGWHFYGIGNIGDSKKTDNTRVNVKGDPYEFGIEITDNGLLLSGFNTGVFYISEASKIRSQTPRNQTNGNADISEASTAQTGHICIDGEYTVSNNSYTFSIINPSATTMYFVPVSGETYYRRFMYVNNTWTEVGEPISFSRTSYGVKYPISQAEWTVQNSENKDVNTYHSALYDFDSGKGWDKSFEFRYDITTKDGETVARDDVEEAMNYLHQKANKKAFADMYSWIATASNTEFRNNLDSWFIKESPLYWYLFTERYTMIDSRAKNTFYHYGKVYISQYEYDGHVLEDLNNITPAQYALTHNLTSINGIDAEIIATEEIKFKKDAAQFIYDNRDTFIKNDGSAAINDGYRFELWDYDMDTALGINNNGQMVFSAGLEDIDKDITGWIYNEAESVIWRRIRENMYPELGALYVRLKTECFNAENLIQEFDMLQNQFPEELWRMDFERKYYRPFYEKNETTYLNDMANGRKRYQRRQFERNMAVYINSKYQRNGSYEPNDLISFRPQFDWRAGLDTTIIIKPYSTMYINFALGNYDNTTDVVSNVNSALSVRVNRGEEYRIEVSDYINEFRNIQCIIYNASRLMSIEGLGKFYCQQFILGAAKKLTTLILGNSDPDYTNRSMNEIGKLGLSAGLPLLETLDLQNIEFQNAPETFALENFPLLKNLNANGCNIRSFTFKDGGMLEKVTFPSGLTKIDFKNLYNLVDTMDENENIISAVTLTGASNLISYNSENSYSNSYQIVQNMLNNAGINRITLLKLNDIDWTIGNIKELEPLKQLKEKLQNNMSIAGKIKVLGYWSTVEKNDYTSIWPKLQFDVTEGTEEQKYQVIFKYDDYTDDEGNTIYGKELMSLYIKHGDPIPDIWEYVDNGVKVHMLDEMPSRKPTARSVYQFGERQRSEYVPYSGWKYAGTTNSITGTPYANRENIVLETWFKVNPHKYPVKWYLWRNKTDVQSLVKVSDVDVEYGEGYDLEAPTIEEIHSANPDIGKPSFNTYEININGGTVAYKIFDGWEKLPTNINPSKNDASYNIYAKWHEGSIALTDLYTANDHLSDEERLLVLSVIDKNTETSYNANIANNIAVNSRFNFTLGQDNDREGAITIVSPDAVFRTDSVNNNQIQTAVQPFLADNNAFTIAIDYCFQENMLYDSTKNNAILASCYYQNNTTNEVSGFALYYNLNTNSGLPVGPRLGFGDMFNNSTQSVPIGRAINSINTYDGFPQGTEAREALITGSPLGSTRNIIVLRHKKNSNVLYIYSGFGNREGLPTEIDIQQLSWNNVVNNAYLNFGQLTASNADDYASVKQSSTRAFGTIYWAKYWPEDLGAGECKRIASWPHEKMTYAVSVLSNNRTGDDRVINATPSIYFTSLETSAHGKIRPLPDTNTYNDARDWGISDMRKICNTQLVAGLPTRLQSILCKTKVNYKTASPVIGSNGINSYTLSSNTTISDDYIYMNTIANILPTGSNTEFSQYSIEEPISDARPFAWTGNSGNISIYYYKTGGGWTDMTNNDIESNKISYYNLRFPYQPLSWGAQNKMRIFKESTTSFPSDTTAYAQINSIAGGIKVGDILMLPNRSGNDLDINNMAYIYVSDEDIRDYGAQVMPNVDIFECEAGGWVPSSNYCTRSMGTGNFNSSFCSVDSKGSVSKSGTGIPSYGVGINYSFSI